MNTEIIHVDNFDPTFILETLLSELSFPTKKTCKFIYYASDLLTLIHPEIFYTSKYDNPLDIRLKFVKSMVPILKHFLYENPLAKYIGETITAPQMIQIAKLPKNAMQEQLKIFLANEEELENVFICGCVLALAIETCQSLQIFKKENNEFVTEIQMAKTWFSKKLRKNILTQFTSFIKKSSIKINAF
jgi:hypothetical protein